MGMVIRESWQREICVRDKLQARTTISYIANRLYPEIPMGKEREAKLLEIPEMARLASILAAERRDCDEAIRRYDLICAGEEAPCSR